MNILIGAIIVIVVTAIAVAAMLLVRRSAPEGSYFQDGDRASGVFGVLATGFSVLLGFIIFLAFESYDESRTGAETEATIVSQQIETAQYLPAATPRRAHRPARSATARSVAGLEWTAIEDGTLGDSINPWSAADVQDAATASRPRRTPSSPRTTDGWTSPLNDSRRRVDRVHGAEGIIPTPLWIVLFVIAADHLRLHAVLRRQRRRRRSRKGILMGSVAVVITGLFLLLAVLRQSAHTASASSSRPRWSGRWSLADKELAVVGLGHHAAV